MKIEKGMQIKVTRSRRLKRGHVYTVVKVVRENGFIHLSCSFPGAPGLHLFNNLVEDGLISPFDDETIELLPVDKPVQRTLF